MYVFYGSFAILLWKCGTQLLREVVYKPLNVENESKKKDQRTKGSKYQSVIY